MPRHAVLPITMCALVAVAACDAGNPAAPTDAVERAELAASPAAPAPSSQQAPAVLPLRRPSSDDAIVIRRGELEFLRTSGTVSIYGTRGFSLVAGVTLTGGLVGARNQCGGPCAPGTTITLLAFWVGNDLPATVTLDGTTYEQVGSLANTASASVRFDGTFVAPPLTKPGATKVKAPFTLTGEFFADNNGVIIRETFTGGGMTTIELVNAPGSPGWEIGSLLYRIKRNPRS